MDKCERFQPQQEFALPTNHLQDIVHNVIANSTTNVWEQSIEMNIVVFCLMSSTIAIKS